MCAEILSWIWCGSDYLSFDCFSILTRVFRNPIFHKTFFDFNLCYIEISIEYMTLDLVWIFSFMCRSWCGRIFRCRRGYLSHFWLLFVSNSSFWNHFSTCFRLLRTFFSLFLELKIVWVDFRYWIYCSVGAAISLSFDCFSIPTCVSECILWYYFIFFRLLFLWNVCTTRG